MIRRFFCGLIACLWLVSGAQAEALTALDPSALIRLHVVAADNSPCAQALKLEIRDACLRCAEICIADAGDAAEAYMRLNGRLDDFQAACSERARTLGYEGEITAEAGVFAFPDRIYGRFRAKAGEYRALRITIGAGKGHNWWCILYPSLCMLDETAQDAGGILAWLRRRMGVSGDAA